MAEPASLIQFENAAQWDSATKRCTVRHWILSHCVAFCAAFCRIVALYSVLSHCRGRDSDSATLRDVLHFVYQPYSVSKCHSIYIIVFFVWPSMLLMCVAYTGFDLTGYGWLYSWLHCGCVATSVEVYSTWAHMPEVGFSRVSVMSKFCPGFVMLMD